MAGARRILPRDIAHYPLPGMNAPVGPKFSADCRFVTYLYSADNSLTRGLWCYDRETRREFRLLQPSGGGDSDATVSREEALRRERQRQLASGVTSYAWSERGDTLLFPLQGDLYVQRGAEGEPRRVTQGGGCIDPQLNRDGTMAAFVKEGELYSLDLTTDGAAPLRLTHDASPPGLFDDRPVTNGLAEFIAQEEMGRSSGFWWSPDGRWLAFEQVDASPVPLFVIPHTGTEAAEMEAHRYPFAGAANVRVRLGVVPARGGDPCWLSLGDDTDSYLARVSWTPDNLLLVQVESRDQTRLDVLRIDPETGRSRLLWRDEVHPWVNLHDDLRFVRREGDAEDDYRILWTSEREGRRHVYLYSRDGDPLDRLTDGSTFIDRVVGVDAERGAVYVEGYRGSPLERHLFRLPLSGGPAEQVTQEPGMHSTVLAPDGSCFVDSFSSVETPPRMILHGLAEKETYRMQWSAPPDPRLEELALRPPRFVQVPARDGTPLHAALYLPESLPAGTTAPVVVNVYGGPHVQTVQNGWQMTANMRSQYLAQEGFIVLLLDNRGSARRGLAFEGAIDRNMGDLEVRDQEDGVRWLAANVPEADISRTGVYGWSYGGYMALMCLMRAPDLFKAAVAGAPVTSWDGYDTHYTERYMGTPAGNPDGYRAARVMTHAENMRGALMLVHGMIDENVHFRHTGRLITKLIELGKPYEVQIYPEERHSPRREEDRVFMEERIVDFFKRNL